MDVIATTGSELINPIRPTRSRIRVDRGGNLVRPRMVTLGRNDVVDPQETTTCPGKPDRTRDPTLDQSIDRLLRPAGMHLQPMGTESAPYNDGRATHGLWVGRRYFTLDRLNRFVVGRFQNRVRLVSDREPRR